MKIMKRVISIEIEMILSFGGTRSTHAMLVLRGKEAFSITEEKFTC